MNVIPRTMAISQMGKRPDIVTPMLKNGPIVITSRSEQIGVMVDIDEWNRTAIELRNLRLLAESRRIADRNDANDSWIDGDEMDRRMAARGVVVD